MSFILSHVFEVRKPSCNAASEPVITAKQWWIAEGFVPRARRIFAANLGGLQENVTRHGVQMTGKSTARAVITGS